MPTLFFYFLSILANVKKIKHPGYGFCVRLFFCELLKLPQSLCVTFNPNNIKKYFQIMFPFYLSLMSLYIKLFCFPFYVSNLNHTNIILIFFKNAIFILFRFTLIYISQFLNHYIIFLPINSKNEIKKTNNFVLTHKNTK